MGATLLAEPEKETRDLEKKSCSIADLLRPDLFVDGREPEMRVVHHGLSWERYLALDKMFGDNRSGPRFYYSDDALEIMTTSSEHERIKKWIADFMADYFLEMDAKIAPRGQATMRLPFRQAGAEPDESWCIGDEKEFPDLVLEIALTSGGVSKLKLYQRFAVPEVWFWRSASLEVYSLLADGSGYERVENGSRLLPDLNTSLLERCVALSDWRAARRAFREGLAAGR